jgi:hypothetical protein
MVAKKGRAVMAERMIAVCGLDCATCDGYLATQAEDEAWKERVAAKWAKDYDSPNIDAAYVTCDGCLAFEGRLGGHCFECEVRACGVERHLPNCAHCAEYDSCQKIASFIEWVPQVKPTLDEIRAAL